MSRGEPTIITGTIETRSTEYPCGCYHESVGFWAIGVDPCKWVERYGHDYRCDECYAEANHAAQEAAL